MSTTINRDEVVREGNEAVRRTLQAVLRYRRLTARDLSNMTGVPYNTVQRYTGGHGQLTGGYLQVFAQALSVPRFVLAMDEDQAVGWVLENCPNGSLGVADIDGLRRTVTANQPSLFDDFLIDLTDHADVVHMGDRRADVTGPATFVLAATGTDG